MTIANLWALVMAMLALAAVPSPSVFAVVARALTSGFWPGAAMAVGIGLGDCVFIGLAMFGLTAVADSWAIVFALIKIAGAVYLLVLGITLWQVKATAKEIQRLKPSSIGMSLLGGLFLTLGDPKAILFYVSFFPAFVDLEAVTWLDALGLCAIALLTVCGTKVIYAFLAHQSRQIFQDPKVLTFLNRLGGITMIATACLIFADLK